MRPSPTFSHVSGAQASESSNPTSSADSPMTCPHRSTWVVRQAISGCAGRGQSAACGVRSISRCTLKARLDVCDCYMHILFRIHQGGGAFSQPSATCKAFRRHVDSGRETAHSCPTWGSIIHKAPHLMGFCCGNLLGHVHLPYHPAL